MEKLIIFGGTFDPVHNGHIRIARFASLTLNADIVFVPARNPRWKKPVASIEDRLEMLKIALKKENAGSFFISNFEINSKEPTNYTIDTVKHFVDKYKDRELYLLIGLDQVESFHEWKDAEEISKLAKIVFVSRPGVNLDNDNIKKFNMTPLIYDKSGTVSSSAIRHLDNLDTPKEVLDYIEKHDLYYIKRIKSLYSTKRYSHALSVANLAYSIAMSNKLDIYNECYIAGLLHDIGKLTSENEQLNIMKKHYSKYLENLHPAIYHQFVSEYIARNTFNINNEIILDAIMYHTTGKANMPPATKIIYSADKIDPLRGFNSVRLIERCMVDFHLGFHELLKANRDYLLKKGRDISNKLTDECFALYLGKEK